MVLADTLDASDEAVGLLGCKLVRAYDFKWNV